MTAEVNPNNPGSYNQSYIDCNIRNGGCDFYCYHTGNGSSDYCACPVGYELSLNKRGCNGWLTSKMIFQQAKGNVWWPSWKMVWGNVHILRISMKSCFFSLNTDKFVKLESHDSNFKNMLGNNES